MNLSVPGGMSYAVKCCNTKNKALWVLLAACVVVPAAAGLAESTTRRERELAAEIGRLRRQMFEMVSEEPGGKEQADVSDSDSSRLKRELADRDEAYESLKGKYVKLGTRYKSLKGKNDELRRSADRKSSRPASGSPKEKEMQAEIDRLRADLFKMASQEPSGETSPSSDARTAKKLDRKTREYTALSQKYEDLEDQYDKAVKANKNLKKKGSKMSGSSREWSRKERELKAEIDGLNVQLEGMAAQKSGDSGAREAKSLKAKMARLQKAYRQLKQQYTELGSHYEDAIDANKELERGLMRAKDSSDRSSKEKALIKEISRLRTELFQVSRRTGTAAKGGSEAASSTDAELKRVSRNYRDLKAHYTKLRVNYDSALKANRALQQQSSTSAGMTRSVEAREAVLDDEIAGLQGEINALRASAASRDENNEADTGRLKVEHVALADRYNRMEKKFNAAARQNNELRAEVAALSSARARRPAKKAAPVRRTASRAAAPVAKAKHLEGLTGKAVELMRAGKYVDAESVLVEAAKANPDDMNLLYLFGTLRCRQGRFVDAVKILKRASSSNYDDAKARIALGGAYMALGDHVNARMELEMAVGFEPDMSEGHFGLAQVLLAGTPSDVGGARDEYYEALRLGARPDKAFEEKLSRALAKLGSQNGQ